jgi:8-oxo-dGTP pyrophosphatase MutT (NUDIX family)
VEADGRARPLAAAGALFFDDDGHLLIVEPVYKSTWEIPGGAVEHGETPQAACARELREELGIELDVGRLLVVDWATGSTEEPEGRVRFVFDGGVLTEERLDGIDLPPDELESWACVPVEDLFVMLSGDLSRRVTAALDAIAKGATYYLENGNRA